MFNIVVVAGVLITVLTGIPVYLQLRRHPSGLSVLFFAEMWERFSYYGMRGLLVFYLTEHFLFDDSFANGQYASYTTLVYLLPLVGGYVADRWLGSRKAIVFGALLLVAGHFTMAIEGPAAKETLTYQGHAYNYALNGRMDARTVCLQVGDTDLQAPGMTHSQSSSSPVALPVGRRTENSPIHLPWPGWS